VYVLPTRGGNESFLQIVPSTSILSSKRYSLKLPDHAASNYDEKYLLKWLMHLPQMTAQFVAEFKTQIVDGKSQFMRSRHTHHFDLETVKDFESDACASCLAFVILPVLCHVCVHAVLLFCSF